MSRRFAACCGRAQGWVRCSDGARMGSFVAVVAVASVVPVSLSVSMVRRVSTRTVDCCLEHERQTLKLLGPPRGGRHRRVGRGVDHGSGPQPLRGDGCVEAGREGLCAGRRRGPAQDGRDGPDLGGDHERGPRVAGAPRRRAGELGGDGGDRGLLEAVLLPARGCRVRVDVGQRPPGEEPARPQVGRLRCGVASQLGAHGLVRVFVRAARADP